MHHAHYEPLALVRDATRQTDAEIRDIKRRYQRGAISESTAIKAMRQAGACEPEIFEALAA